MEKQKRHSFATAPSGAALNDIKNPENILNKNGLHFSVRKRLKELYATMQIVFVGILLVK